MENGEVGEEYIISNDAFEVRNVIETASNLTGIDPPRDVSPVLFRALATLFAPLHRVWQLPEGFEPEMLRTYGSTDIRVDNSRAIEELGIEHRDLEAGMYSSLTWEYEQLGRDPEEIREHS